MDNMAAVTTLQEGLPEQVTHRWIWGKTATINAPSHSQKLPVKKAPLSQQGEASWGPGKG